ncbi:7TM-DISM domain-containing protein, partial [Pseudomonas aeruginosa]
MLGSTSPSVADPAGASSVPLQPTATSPVSNQHWRLLRDESAQLRIADVLQRKVQFRPLAKRSFIFPASLQAVWLQVQLPVQK